MAKQASASVTPAGPAPSLLHEERFLRYCLAKLLQLLGQNALIYGLFIAVIQKQESALATSFFVMASVVPSIFFSLPGGVFADLLPKKPVLVLTLLLRMLVVYWFLSSDPGIEAVIGLTFLVWTVYQFYSPAESAVLLAVAPREKVAEASSFLQGLSLAGQLLGAGLLAPVALRILGSDGLYLVVLVCFAASAVVFMALPRLSPGRAPTAARRVAAWRALPAGFRTIKGDAGLASLTLMRVLLDAGMLMFIVAAPVFIEDVLDAGAENAIYIAVPGALGLALGLLLAPPLLSLTSTRGVALAGFMVFTGVLLLLPFVDTLAPQITGLFGPPADFVRFIGVPDAIVATMVLLPLAGFGSSLVHVAARAQVYQHVPSDLVAQVFATQSALGSVAALLPTVASGVVLDILPVRVALALIGAGLAAAAIGAWERGSHRPHAAGLPQVS